ncbi:MAG TPA: sigma 54-interacting transcriptional regulator [Cytophagaceae bacterium]|nr:sigma 54-interacting transcriptional regulator [Cytophagaceae bacterium]
MKPTIKTLGALKASGYQSRSVKEEMRHNLVEALRNKKDLFDKIKGYEETVIPQMQTAVLSRHNIIFLGLRGQAKTRMARLMTNLLDEYIPVVAGSELNDDPLQPLSRYAVDLIQEKGDDTPITWLHRDDRYTEKLATPDVSVSDLIGDLDPIKAATMKLTYADERVIHFGLIPRSHRGIFVINELPDLQPRIQVALFNILQEGDIQIRGFKLRLPLDIQFIFTANPEDYTNRGSIITPLKDRIDSQILTHYPKAIDISRQITEQEAKLSAFQKENIKAPELIKQLVEQISFEARKSEYVDQKSGVSARLTISAFENMYSTAERRMLLNGDTKTVLRVADVLGVIPSVTGKIELVYEGELEGISSVAIHLIGKAIRQEFETLFPNPEKGKKLKKGQDKEKKNNIYKETVDWFNNGNHVDLLQTMSNAEYEKALISVPGLEATVSNLHPSLSKEDKLLYMEFLLHGLAEYSQISKHKLDSGIQFKDLLGSLLNNIGAAGEDDEEQDDFNYRNN